KELGSDKVFDVVGRLFEGVSLKQYMERAISQEGADEAVRALEGALTKGQGKALGEREGRRFGGGGEVKGKLGGAPAPGERGGRLLPGYVRRFIKTGAPLLGLGIEGDLDQTFRFRPLTPGALDFLWPLLETYPTESRGRLSVYKPKDESPSIFLHPGEPIF